MILPYCKVMIGLAVHTPVPNAPLREMEVESRWPRGTNLTGFHHAGSTLGSHKPAHLLLFHVS